MSRTGTPFTPNVIVTSGTMTRLRHCVGVSPSLRIGSIRHPKSKRDRNPTASVNAKRRPMPLWYSITQNWEGKVNTYKYEIRMKTCWGRFHARHTTAMAWILLDRGSIPRYSLWLRDPYQRRVISFSVLGRWSDLRIPTKSTTSVVPLANGKRPPWMCGSSVVMTVSSLVVRIIVNAAAITRVNMWGLRLMSIPYGIDAKPRGNKPQFCAILDMHHMTRSSSSQQYILSNWIAYQACIFIS